MVLCRGAGLSGKKWFFTAKRSFSGTNTRILDRSAARYIIGGTTAAALWGGAMYCQDNPAIPRIIGESSISIVVIGTAICIVYAKAG